jgi:hypothetical protein
MKTFLEIKKRLEALGAKKMTLSDAEVAKLDSEIDELLVSIAQERTAIGADPKLLQLGEIQDLLCTICFDTDLPYSEKQRQLVRNYDRWPDSEQREKCFGWIKAGEFP